MQSAVINFPIYGACSDDVFIVALLAIYLFCLNQFHDFLGVVNVKSVYVYNAACTVDHCLACELNDTNKCEKCKEGYTLNKNKKTCERQSFNLNGC